jgi:tripartite-type tricarboxylate transporter receptor subunit TctC
MLHRRTTLAGLGTLLAAPALHAQPAEWKPDRPVRLIVTYPPGGVTDIVGRIVSEPLSRELGQAVVVENRAGAGGNIGTGAATQAEPDGYTILFGTTAMFGVNPVLYANSGVDAVRDFLCLGTIGEVANVLSVIPGRVRARDLRAFIAEAKSRPLIFGSVGNGSSSHLSAAVFLKEAGIDATHVPYRGSSPLVAAMLASEVDFGFDATATSAAHIQSGAFRPLAVTTARRAGALPQVPTLKESGMPDVDLGIWFGLFVSRRMPPAITRSLAAALERTRTPQTEQRLQSAYVDPLYIPQPEVDGYIRASALRWQSIARDARISLD